MSEPAVTRITTQMPFETVKQLLKAHCREPFTIMVASPADQDGDDNLIVDLIFADDTDLTRFRRALGKPLMSRNGKSPDANQTSWTRKADRRGG